MARKTTHRSLKIFFIIFTIVILILLLLAFISQKVAKSQNCSDRLKSAKQYIKNKDYKSSYKTLSQDTSCADIKNKKDSKYYESLYYLKYLAISEYEIGKKNEARKNADKLVEILSNNARWTKEDSERIAKDKEGWMLLDMLDIQDGVR